MQTGRASRRHSTRRGPRRCPTTGISPAHARHTYGKRARKASTPVHALLNYTYAILEVEATIACHAVGFDPSLGIMHADHRYRGSLASDLMEPARPTADAFVLDLLDQRELSRGDVVENREGVCRVG